MTQTLLPFAIRLLDWFDQHGRHDLPWQVSDDPYKVWVSEIMLQQTQVKTVLNYFDRFMARFPDIEALAQASWEDVAPYWAGLGYYARARNLHKAAQQVAKTTNLPNSLDGWMALPGIGQSTAGALMSLGLRQYGVIMDGNVKRVLSRHQIIEGDSMSSAVIAQLWQLAEQLTPVERNADYTQAIMDMGATLCTIKKPLCLYCPLNADCKAYQQDRVQDFPQKNTKKATPIKQATVLILSHKDQWLWQARPTSGLWGGLNALPIMESKAELDTFLRRYQLTQHQALDTVKHVFTHFTWLLTPLRFELDDAQWEQIQADFPEAQWLNIQTAQQSGIPTAMQKIIKAAV